MLYSISLSHFVYYITNIGMQCQEKIAAKRHKILKNLRRKEPVLSIVEGSTQINADFLRPKRKGCVLLFCKAVRCEARLPGQSKPETGKESLHPGSLPAINPLAEKFCVKFNILAFFGKNM
jgi:hypothetical protein